MTHPVTRILDGLFLGNADSAKDVGFIQLNKIARIVNCEAQSVPNLFSRFNVEYLAFRWTESESSILFDDKGKRMKQIFRFIEGARARGSSVLVHSVDGVSQCCCVVMSYLMYKFRWSVDKALDFVLAKRPECRPSPKLQKQLAKAGAFLQLPVGSGAPDWLTQPAEVEEIVVRNTMLNSGMVTAFNTRFVQVTNPAQSPMSAKQKCKLCWKDGFKSDATTQYVPGVDVQRPFRLSRTFASGFANASESQSNKGNRDLEYNTTELKQPREGIEPKRSILKVKCDPDGLKLAGLYHRSDSAISYATIMTAMSDDDLSAAKSAVPAKSVEAKYAEEKRVDTELAKTPGQTLVSGLQPSDANVEGASISDTAMQASPIQARTAGSVRAEAPSYGITTPTENRAEKALCSLPGDQKVDGRKRMDAEAIDGQSGASDNRQNKKRLGPLSQTRPQPLVSVGDYTGGKGPMAALPTSPPQGLRVSVTDAQGGNSEAVAQRTRSPSPYAQPGSPAPSAQKKVLPNLDQRFGLLAAAFLDSEPTAPKRERSMSVCESPVKPPSRSPARRASGSVSRRLTAPVGGKDPPSFTSIVKARCRNTSPLPWAPALSD